MLEEMLMNIVQAMSDSLDERKKREAFVCVGRSMFPPLPIF